MTIGEIYGGPVEKKMLPARLYAVGDIPMKSDDLIFGMELEIEHFRQGTVEIEGFNYTADNSLRGNSIEAITYPTKAKHLQTLLEKFFKEHKITSKNYSERCSTHVHMNAQGMTYEQLKTLATIYQTVERLLFHYVGNERDENVFCVPWYESGLTPHFIDNMSSNADGTLARWIKYAALNFLPIRKQGTVEFRHMHGTCDVPYLMGWINLLSCMHKYAMENTFEKMKENILSMNTVSNYDGFLNDVFQNHTWLLVKPENYKELLSIGVVDTKLMLMTNKKKKKETAEINWGEAAAAQLQADGLDNFIRAARVAPAPLLRQHEILNNVLGWRRHTNVDLLGPHSRHAYIRAGWEEYAPNCFQLKVA